jgi:hypothetical protein
VVRLATRTDREAVLVRSASQCMSTTELIRLLQATARLHSFSELVALGLPRLTTRVWPFLNRNHDSSHSRL